MRKSVDGGRRTTGRRARAFRALLLVVTVALAACGDDDVAGPGDDPRGVDENRLTFITPSDTAPPLLTNDTSLVARRGEAFRVEIFYQDPQQPSQAGERFLRFELDPASLSRYPDDHPMAGAAFQPGDTVTIRIRVASDTLLADFEPNGLRFDPDAPAELELHYVEADRDTDDDGEDEPEFEDDVDLWRQERPGDPWFRVGEIKDFEDDGMEAFLESFTRFAAAI